MKKDWPAFLFGIILVVTFVVSFMLVVMALWPDSECLIYGIDYNGRNDPFGLFCW